MNTGSWVVAIYFPRGDGEKLHAYVDRICMSSGEFNNTSACTLGVGRMRRWKTEAGARKAADAYERNNPGSRCRPVAMAEVVVPDDSAGRGERETP